MIPALRTADMIELHEHVIAGLSAEVLSRFRATHEIYVVGTAARDPNGYPLLKQLSPKQQAFVISEHRPANMEWALYLTKENLGG